MCAIPQERYTQPMIPKQYKTQRLALFGHGFRHQSEVHRFGQEGAVARDALTAVSNDNCVGMRHKLP